MNYLRKYFVLCGTLIFFQMGHLWAYEPEENHFCIIGAGASGVAFAGALADLGYGLEGGKIKIFEKNHRPGGKCNSEANEGDVHEMGAAIAAPTYKWVRYMADKVGHRMVPHPRIQALTKRDGQYLVQNVDEYLAIPALSNPFNVGKNLAILLGIKRYNDLAKRAMAPDGSIDYQNLSEEFYRLDAQGNKQLKSFAVFAEEQGLTEFLPWFLMFVNSFGYLTLDKIPALYVMDYIDNLGGYWAYLKGFATTRRLERGYQVLLEEVLEHFKDRIDLRLGATVKKIDRFNRTLTYESNGEEYEEACSYFIVATEPGKIIDMLDSPTRLERLMKKTITYSPYRTLVVSSTIPRGAYFLPEEALEYRPGQVMLIANDFKSQEKNGMLHTLVYTAEDGDSIYRSPQEVLNSIRSQMADYGIEVGDIVKDADGKDLHRIWPNYFPHFNTYILDQIDLAQGMFNTYYIGSAYSGFELVERAMAHGVKIAHAYFANDLHPIPSEDRFDDHRSAIGIPTWSEQD